jgi:hypothetical protein
MEYVVLGAVVVLLLIGKGFYDKKKYKRIVRRRLIEEFGTVSDEEYTSEKMQSLKNYYNATKRKKQAEKRKKMILRKIFRFLLQGKGEIA